MPDQSNGSNIRSSNHSVMESVPLNILDMSVYDAVREVTRGCINVMKAFPAAYIPSSEVPSEFDIYTSMDVLLRRREVTTKLQDIVAEWPDELYPSFVQASLLVPLLLTQLDWKNEWHFDEQTARHFSARIPTINALYLARNQAGRSPQAVKYQPRIGHPLPPPNFSELYRNSLWNEMERRALGYVTPVQKTITTLLGPNALRMFVRPSAKGFANLQPQELSRVCWSNLDRVYDQIAIEYELQNFDRVNGQATKSIVAICWTLVALASFMQAAIFLSEGDAFVRTVGIEPLSVTISEGRRSHALWTFTPQSMIYVTEVILKALDAAEITSNDLMWMANGLADRCTVIDALGKEVPASKAHKYKFFLSHRGKDAKRVLAGTLLAAKGSSGVFLDCLALPKSKTNMRFLFDSLAGAEMTIIVDTPDYHSSPWCRKEEWFAEALSALGCIQIERLSLEDAVSRLDNADLTDHVVHLNADERPHPIGYCITQDIDHPMYEPNIVTLERLGADLACFDAVDNLWGSATGPLTAKAISNAVLELFQRVVQTAPEGDPVALWVTALKYAVALLAQDAKGRSPTDIRRCVDQMIRALEFLRVMKGARDVEFKKHATSYLALIASAALIDMAGEHLALHLYEPINIVLEPVCIVRQGVLLFDMRHPGQRRNFQLQFLSSMLYNNVSGIGIIQNADNPVHNFESDGMSLSVLPCVTLYPGMEALFPELSSASGTLADEPT
jgi:hypothetical protein